MTVNTAKTTNETVKPLEYATNSPLNRRKFTATLLGAGAASFLLALNPYTAKIALAEPTSAEKQAEADEVQKKLDAWAAELDAASDKYYLALEAHDTALANMEAAEVAVATSEAEVSALQEKLAARAKSMYKGGEISFLEVLFGASDFTQFTTSWDLLNSMTADDATLVAQSKQAKTDAQEAKDEYIAQEKIAQEKFAEAEEIKKAAEDTVAAIEAELASLETEIAELIKKEKEEEERRQREAAAAAMANNNNGGSLNHGDGVPVYTGGLADVIMNSAISQLGVPYVWGGTTAYGGLDCSGLTQWCYRQAGVSIPRVTESQMRAATSVLSLSEAQPGDILWRYGHVGIYMGNGAYIHAPQTGDVVRWAYNVGQFTNALRF